MPQKRFFYLLFVIVTVMFFSYVVKVNIENVMKNSGWFYLEKVSINGLKYVPQESVLKLLPPASSISIFSINAKDLKQAIEKDKRLKVLSIKTNLPNELIVNLKEVYGDYIVLLDDKDYYDVSKEMKILAKNEEILNYDKLIFSISSDFLKKMEVDFTKKPEKEASVTDGETLIERSSFLKTLFFHTEGLVDAERDFLDLIGGIRLNEDASVEVFMRDKQQKILMDSTFKTEDLRLARYAYLYTRSQKMNGEIKAIDVRDSIVKYVF